MRRLAFSRGRQFAWRHLAVDGDGSAWNAVSIADHEAGCVASRPGAT
jgi:hypothetical protein